MTRLTAIALCTLWILISAAGCITTPLPIPPTAHPDQIYMDSQNGPSIHIAGDAGAVDTGDEEAEAIRITRVGEPIDGPPFVETELADDGSFLAEVPGSSEDLFYFELITAERDIFLVAISGGMDGPIQAVDPGPDSDGDGSPDAIDCAPDDDSIEGRRCE